MGNKLELLAPVGSMESLYAAVQNGANAVYLGGKLFNARYHATNFDYEELKEAVEYAHLRSVKVYVTVNILIDDQEMEDALDYVRYIYEIGVDGIIVQDIGLASLVAELFPDLEIHGSTQMTINNYEGANFLHNIGFTRVVLARETPIEEIIKISKKSPIELEAFIHGALCVSYSGQCLMSSMIGGRSGNRGRCAQPCRMPSSLIDKEGQAVDGWEEKHILSPKDLNTVEEIEKLIDAGIISFKIEGRMKRPEYVATVVNVYRKAIDLGSDSVTDEEKENVRQMFNRGFTKGLTFGDFGHDFISYDRPDNRGIYLGEVIGFDNEKAIIKLEKDINPGDGIEFKLGQNKYKGLRAEEIGLAGEEYIVEKPGYIEIGSLVYRTSSVELLEEAKESYKEDETERKVDMKVKVALGEKPELITRYGNKEIRVIGEDEVEASKNLPLTEDRIIEQLSRLGDTVYEIDNIDISLEEGCFMTLSGLNYLRRETTRQLDEGLLSSGREVDEMSYLEKRDELLFLDLTDVDEYDNFAIKVETFNQFKKLDLDKVDRLYLMFYEDRENLSIALKELEDYEGEIFIGTEKILYSEELEILKNTLDEIGDYIHGVSVANLGTFNLIKENYEVLIHGDIGLNGFNSYSIRFLAEEGLTSIDLSAELNIQQIEKIIETSQIPISSIVYGYIPVMTSKHCPMALVKGCADDSECKTCEYSQGYSIKDRIGAEFKMQRGRGFTNIYNPMPIFVLDNIRRISDLDISMMRMDLSFEIDGIEELQDIYYDAIKGNIGRDEIDLFIEDFRENNEITNGHYFRGIID